MSFFKRECFPRLLSFKFLSGKYPSDEERDNLQEARKWPHLMDLYENWRMCESGPELDFPEDLKGTDLFYTEDAVAVDFCKPFYHLHIYSCGQNHANHGLL